MGNVAGLLIGVRIRRMISRRVEGLISAVRLVQSSTERMSVWVILLLLTAS